MVGPGDPAVVDARFPELELNRTADIVELILYRQHSQVKRGRDRDRRFPAPREGSVGG